MDLKDLFTYMPPEDKLRHRVDLAKERLRDYTSKLPEHEKRIVAEGLFMEFLGELENKVNAIIQTMHVAGFDLDNDGFNKIANRCFKAIIESKEREETTAKPGEHEFMIMFVKAMGNILNETYKIKKIYFDND